MTLGSHQTSVGRDQARLTPRFILDALGAFDLDPCAADPRPWDIARVNWTAADDGLARDWPPEWRTWCNPPFDSRVVGRFVAKMVAQNHGTMLIHARTETRWFAPLFDRAAAMFFLRGRVNFLNTDGTPCTIERPGAKHFGKAANSGAPVVLVAFGGDDADALAFCGLAGKFVPLIVPRSFLVALAAAPEAESWRAAVIAWLRAQGGRASLDAAYRAFAGHAKSARNPHWRAKVRQTLQRVATRVGPAEWAEGEAA